MTKNSFGPRSLGITDSIATHVIVNLGFRSDMAKDAYRGGPLSLS